MREFADFYGRNYASVPTYAEDQQDIYKEHS
jgi:hypothetical protein